MAQIEEQTEARNHTKPHLEENHQSLKGTFVSVLLVGGFILVSWIAVFILFINRG